MSRKASIKNLRKAVDDTAARVSELEKQLEEAKAKQAEAQNKVREREKEMNELLLINEVKEYIESERVKRKDAAEKKIDAIIPAENEMKEDTQNDSMVSDDNTE